MLIILTVVPLPSISSPTIWSRNAHRGNTAIDSERPCRRPWQRDCVIGRYCGPEQPGPRGRRPGWGWWASVVRGGCGLAWRGRLVTSLENSHIFERMTSSCPSSPPILSPHVPNILSNSFSHWICSSSTVLRRPHPPWICRLRCHNKRKNPSLLFFFAGTLQTEVVLLPFRTLIYQGVFFSQILFGFPSSSMSFFTTPTSPLMDVETLFLRKVSELKAPWKDPFTLARERRSKGDAIHFRLIADIMMTSVCWGRSIVYIV